MAPPKRQKSLSDIAQFHQWMKSLTWDELEQALEVPIANSNDEAFLHKAWRLQAPLPTPLHPRVEAHRATNKMYEEVHFDTDFIRVQRESRKRPRLLRLIPKQQQSQHPNPFSKSRKHKQSATTTASTSGPCISDHYDIQARAFVNLTQDGTPWGIPPLERVRVAEETLANSTVFCTALDGTQTLFVRFQPQRHSTAPKSPSVFLGELLRIVSRGNFAQRLARHDALFPEWFLAKNNHTPTMRFFSFGQLIAALFEMTLMRAFHKYRQQSRYTKPRWYQPQLAQTIERIWANRSCRTRVLIRTMRHILQSVDLSKLPYARDCFLLHLLSLTPNSQSAMMQSLSRNNSALSFWICGVPDRGSPQSYFQSLIRHELQTLVAAEMEHDLLKVEEELLVESPRDSIPPPKSGKKARSNNKKKKKKANQQRYPKASTPQRHGLVKVEEETAADFEREEESHRSESSTSGDEATLLTRHYKHSIDFPETNASISDRARNRNIVTVLGILDGVVSDVFGKVGLEQTPKEEDTSDDHEWGDAKSLIKAVKKSKQNEHVKKATPAAQSKQVATQNNTNAKKPHNDEFNMQYHNTHDWPPLSPWDSSVGGMEKVEKHQVQNQHSLSPMEPSVSTVEQPSAFSGTGKDSRGAFDIFASPYGNLAGGFFLRSPEKSIDFAWDTHDFAIDQWGLAEGARERSIMEDLFLSQERREQEEENIMASSTIASIASSTNDEAYPETEYIPDDDLTENSDPPDFPERVKPDGQSIPDEIQKELAMPANGMLDESDRVGLEELNASEATNAAKADPQNENASESEVLQHDSHEENPSPPPTPSPNLSPILVSLADLQVIKKSGSSDNLPVLRQVDSEDSNTNQTTGSDGRSFSSLPAGSNFPPPRMVTSLSREDLRLSAAETGVKPKEEDKSFQRSRSSSHTLPDTVDPFSKPAHPKLKRSSSGISRYQKQKARDDNDLKIKGAHRRRSDALDSYRTVASRSLVKARDDNDVGRPTISSPPRNTSHRNTPSGKRSELKHQIQYSLGRASAAHGSAQSEIGDDELVQNWHDSRRSSNMEDTDDKTTTRDGSTTITSAVSQPRESEENLREERDTYRDLCLTLGAEVAKLKNMLASQHSFFMPSSPAFDYTHQEQPFSIVQGPSNFFDPSSVGFVVNGPRFQQVTAMSDAGFLGEHESMASEDDLLGGTAAAQHHRHISSVASDASMEQSATHHQINFTVGVPMNQSNQGTIPITGAQSRLSIDISHFVDVINSQLRKQEVRRAKAAERMTRLVTTMWPRAQCKLYGSHVTGLGLPTSDVDFVICLPAVQKDTPAVAPGVLEGRNAINETSQKMLARKLKSESWIDPRSMKFIERTVVPVIKVATKDTKAKTLQLDITFDNPSHHGLEAVELVNHFLEEYPLIRPLVLVLKQFLLDRSLLTGYTGGLSSYCLFLMTARYLQEQPVPWADCGALLMGFLDFYGNHVSFPSAPIVWMICSLSQLTYASSSSLTLEQPGSVSA